MNLSKKNKIAIISICISVFCIVSLVSYAYFSGAVAGRSQEMVITTGNMSVSFSQGNIIGSSDNMIPGQSVMVPFEVSNTGTVTAYYDLYFNNVINSFVDKNDLVYTLVSDDGGFNIDETVAPSVSGKFASGIGIGVGQTHHYTLTITFKVDDTDQGDNQGVTFSSIIGIEEIEIAQTPVFAYLYANEYNHEYYKNEQDCNNAISNNGYGSCSPTTMEVANYEYYDEEFFDPNYYSLEECNTQALENSSEGFTVSCEMKENKYTIPMSRNEYDTLEECQNDNSAYMCEFNADKQKYQAKTYNLIFDDENSCYEFLDSHGAFNFSCELKSQLVSRKYVVDGSTHGISLEDCLNDSPNEYLGNCIPTGNTLDLYIYKYIKNDSKYTLAFNSTGVARDDVYVVKNPSLLSYDEETDEYTYDFITWEDNRRINVVDFENKVVPLSTAYLLRGIPFERIDNINNLYTKYVKNMSYMFFTAGASGANININLGNNFDTSSVTNMSHMFGQFGRDANSVSVDLGNAFDTSNVAQMDEMFASLGEHSNSVGLNLGNSFDTSSVTTMAAMFKNVGGSAQNFSLNLGDKFNTSGVTEGYEAFCGVGSNSGYIPPNNIPSSWSECAQEISV